MLSVVDDRKMNHKSVLYLPCQQKSIKKRVNINTSVILIFWKFDVSQKTPYKQVISSYKRKSSSS